jgi:hypothetical protein
MWEEAKDVINELSLIYSDDNRFVDGACNCDACVEERVHEQSAGLFEKLYTFFPKRLNVYEFSSSYIIVIFKVEDHAVFNSTV